MQGEKLRAFRARLLRLDAYPTARPIEMDFQKSSRLGNGCTSRGTCIRNGAASGNRSGALATAESCATEFPMLRQWAFILIAMAALVRPARAGPWPYVSDDPEPTDYQHFEIYTFNSGTTTRAGTGAKSGIDFNYGAAPNLQLTATVPVGFEPAAGGATNFGLSNVELAAKYRFLHQDGFGLDVSVFPRIFLPSGSNSVGDNRASVFLPVWVQKDWSGGWSAFGGG